MNFEFTFSFIRLFDFLILIGLPLVIVFFSSSSKKDYLEVSNISLMSVKTDDSKIAKIIYGKPTSYSLITEELPNAYFSIILGVFASSIYFKQILGLLFIFFLLWNCAVYRKTINITPNQNTDLETFEKLTKAKLKKCKIHICIMGTLILIALFFCFFSEISFMQGE